MNDFSERLTFLLAGRRLFPWVMTTGVSKGVADSMNKGKIPGPEILRLIRLRECVSIDWLIAGDGAPFILEPCRQADNLKPMLTSAVPAPDTEEPVRLHFFTDGQQLVLMPESPADYEYKGKALHYRRHRLIPVPVTAETAAVVHRFQQAVNAPPRSYEPSLELCEHRLTHEQMQSLLRGQLGPFQLLGKLPGELPGELPGQLPDRTTEKIQSHTTARTFRIITSAESLFNELLDHQPPVQTDQAMPLSTRLMRSVILCVDSTALEEGIELSADERARVYTAIYRHAQRARVTADQLDSSSIITALELR